MGTVANRALAAFGTLGRSFSYVGPIDYSLFLETLQAGRNGRGFFHFVFYWATEFLNSKILASLSRLDQVE